MSKIVAPLGEASVLELLVYGDRIDTLPATTQWWRQILYPGPDGNVSVTQIDNVDAPTQVTVTWYDHYGDNDDTLEPYAVKLTHKEPDEDPWGSPPIRVLQNRTTYFLDVLWYCAPTAGRWEQLTDIGHHVHPDDREHVNELQRAFFAKMMGHSG